MSSEWVQHKVEFKEKCVSFEEALKDFPANAWSVKSFDSVPINFERSV